MQEEADALVADRFQSGGRIGRSHDAHQEAAMRTFPIVISGLGALMSLALFLTADAPACAQDMPDYFKEIVGTETAPAAEVETKNILALNATMLDLMRMRRRSSKRTSWLSTQSSLGSFPARADVSFFIVPVCRRSTRLRFRSPISC
jgi:hypothetical protein